MKLSSDEEKKLEGFFMFVFYDFETSSKEPFGQILNYYFVLTDASWNFYQELEGFVQLNSIQLPDIDAILTTKIDLAWLQKNGELEAIAAQRIHTFLTAILAQYNTVTLVGFNSNAFDLNFLRGLLLRYGYNPYLKFKNKDVLHFLYHVAFLYEDAFPWVKKINQEHSYYSFSLEEMAKAFGILQDQQSHTAKEDVLVLISLVQYIEHFFKLSFSSFIPFQISDEENLIRHLGRQKCRSDEFKWQYRSWAALAPHSGLWVCLQAFTAAAHTNDYLSCIYYKNPNKSFFILEPNHDAEDLLTYHKILDTPLFIEFSKNPYRYFEMTKKNWDIEYQIHELGFNRLDLLLPFIQELYVKPDLWETRMLQLLKTYQNSGNIQDKYLLQLYNRSYLNITNTYSQATTYIKNRYVLGLLHKDPNDFQPFHLAFSRVSALSKQKDCPAFIHALFHYYQSFSSTFSLSTDPS